MKMERALRLVLAALLVAAGPALARNGNEGKAADLTIHAGGTTEEDAGKPAKLVGPDARLQLVVTSRPAGVPAADVTATAHYAVAPEDVVKLHPNGRVTPLKDGTATITATAGDSKAEVQVTVERFTNPAPINFPNQVVPIFTKFGCNSGGCHGKSGGQNGFRLSLLGFEPTEDYEYLVKESLGRRVFPAAPEHSLLLLKAIATIPHGGGEKLKKDSGDYRLLVRWITQAMPYGRPEDPTLSSISVYPKNRILKTDGQQQLKIFAHYSDGSSEDISHTARYEPNDKSMAEVDEGGRVRMMGQPGSVAVMVRYQDRVGVFTALVPLGAEVKTLPPVRNVVDQVVFSRLKELGLPPSEICDDATFLRRVTLDLTGRLPSPESAKKFLADGSADKRDRAVDQLLSSEAYADFFANKWSAILRNRRDKATYEGGNFAFHQWIRTAIAQNRPYDQFVKEILTASGEISRNPAVAWYRQVTKDIEQTEDVAQLFLGVRIQCAHCHHHPYEKWSRQDYYGMTAFFSRVGRKEGLAPDEQRIFHNRGMAQAVNPKTNIAVKPTGLGEKTADLTADDDPRLALAEWMARKDNPFFAKALVNRYWKHFFNRGIVDPEDDMRETNPPSNRELLDTLARTFSEGGFNLKELARLIARSSTYQLSALPNQWNSTDRQSFSRYYPRRLPAEVLLDAIDQANGTITQFTGLPAGIRATQIPDHGGVNSYFLTVFGRPAGASACECERTGDASLAQSLHLLNSQDIHGKMSNGVAKELAADMKRQDAEKLTDLYYRAFGRAPRAEELKVATGHVEKAQPKEKQAAYEDIVWALINTKEFLFNH
jgi:hypothetical protein